MNTQIYAHRGASGYAPENTLEAFELAAKMGAQGVELDVHITKDGYLVVAHDETIDRVSDGTGFIRDMFFDPDLILGEYGLKKEYAFDIKPILLNGKSGEACEMLMENLISSGSRQMPVLFIPETYYLANEEEVDHKVILDD